MRNQHTSSKIARRLAVFSTVTALCALLIEYALLTSVSFHFASFLGYLCFAGLCLFLGFYFFANKYQTEWYDDVTNKNKELQLQALFSTLNPWPILRFDRYGQLISKNSCAKTYFYTLEYGADGYRSVFDFFPELTKEAWQSITQDTVPFELEYNRSGYWLCFYFRSHPQLGVINVYGYDVTAYKRHEQHAKQLQKTSTYEIRKSTQLFNDIYHSIHVPLKSLKKQFYSHFSVQNTNLGQNIRQVITVLDQLENFYELDSTRFKAQYHSFDCRFMFEKIMVETARNVFHTETELVVDSDFGRHDFIVTDGLRLQQTLEALVQFATQRSQKKQVLVKARWISELDSPVSISGRSHFSHEKMFFRVSVHDSGRIDDRILQLFNANENMQSQESDYVNLHLRYIMNVMPMIGGKVIAKASSLGGYEIRIDWPVEPARDHKSADQSQALSDFHLYVFDESSIAAEAAAKTLSRAGASVEFSASEDELLKEIKLHVPDILVYGIAPHQKVNQEFINKVRQAVDHYLPVCLLVSQGENIIGSEFDHLDIEAIVLKPLRNRLLIQGVNQAWTMKEFKVANNLEHVNLVADHPQHLSAAKPYRHHSYGERPVILVVDDDIVVLHLVSDLLMEMGADVEIAENGPDALAILAETSVDLIIMDVRMPFMDGFQTTQEIRAVYSEKIPIVALTASDDRADRSKALQIGMNDYLVKPVDHKTLRERLNRWVSLPGIKERQDQVVMVKVDEKTPLIQVREAMRLLNRDNGLFTRSLLRFYGRFFIEGYTISKLIEAENSDDILIRLHSLRGGAASIGAYLLRDRVFELENVIRNKGICEESNTAIQRLLVLLECILYESKVLLNYFTNNKDLTSPEAHLQEAVSETERKFEKLNESMTLVSQDLTNLTDEQSLSDQANQKHEG